jgi:ABC-type amino acid transport system permease subunit
LLYRGQLVYEQSGQITTVIVVIILIYLLVTIPLTKAISMLEAKLQLAMR